MQIIVDNDRKAIAANNNLFVTPAFDGISDAINSKLKLQGYPDTSYGLDDMPEAIDKIKLGISFDTQIDTGNVENGRWKRPAAWPNLDELTYGDNEFFMTIDNSGRIADPHVNMMVVNNGGNTTYQVGTVSNGVFTATETTTKASWATYTREFTSADPTYPVIRVTAGRITNVRFDAWTKDGRSLNSYDQAIVERVGSLYSQNNAWSLYHIERDKIKFLHLTGNDFQYKWNGCNSIIEIDISGSGSDWSITSLNSVCNNCQALKAFITTDVDTSNWRPTTLRTMFSNCYALETLDGIEDWDTSSWPVTDLYGVFASCFTIKELDLSNWDTSHWNVTTINTLFNNCTSLKKLNIASWDTSNWHVTDMSYCWNCCYNLETIDVPWDTHNWAITSALSVFNTCYSLTYLDLNMWDTSNWNPASFTFMWQNCYALKILKIDQWDTSNWSSMANFQNTWQNCYSLQELDLSNWDTSAWSVTTLQATWNACASLKKLEIGNWVTSHWNVTTLQSTWGGCSSLEYLDIGDWDTSNWHVTTTNAMLNAAYNLRELELHWDVSNFTTAGLNWYNLMNTARSLKKFDITGLDVSRVILSNNSYGICHNAIALETFICGSDNYNKYVPTDKTINQNSSKRITHDSLIEIINMLGPGNGHKINFGTEVKARLTAAEIAVATGKGWTVT